MSIDDLVQKQLLRREFLGLAGLGLASIPIIGCGDDEENGNNSSKYVTHLTKKTDSSGEVSIGDRLVKVKSASSKKGLSGMDVHYFSDGSQGLIEVIDKSGKHYPDFEQISGVSVPTSVGNFGTSTYSLVDQVVFLKDTINDIRDEVVNIDHGTFLGSDKNYNKYCMTMEQIIDTSVKVPLGLVFIAAKAAGVKTKVLKNAGTKLLGSALRKYIEAEHGKQSAYEVWVPKTAVSLCGEKYDGVLCSLTDKDLKNIWNPDKPIWMVKGACNYKGPVKACKGGELFCDDFNGGLSKWKTNLTSGQEKDLVFNNGILQVTKIGGTYIMDSKPTFTIGNGNYALEVRAKTNTDSGITFNIGLENINKGVGVNFLTDSSGLNCDNNSSDTCNDSVPCSTDLINYHTYKFEVNSSGVKYYIDGKLKSTSSKCVPTNELLNINLTCQSDDGKQKTLSVDYVKLTKK